MNNSTRQITLNQSKGIPPIFQGTSFQSKSGRRQALLGKSNSNEVGEDKFKQKLLQLGSSSQKQNNLISTEQYNSNQRIDYRKPQLSIRESSNQQFSRTSGYGSSEIPRKREIPRSLFMGGNSNQTKMPNNQTQNLPPFNKNDQQPVYKPKLIQPETSQDISAFIYQSQNRKNSSSSASIQPDIDPDLLILTPPLDDDSPKRLVSMQIELSSSNSVSFEPNYNKKQLMKNTHFTSSPELVELDEDFSNLDVQTKQKSKKQTQVTGTGLNYQGSSVGQIRNQNNQKLQLFLSEQMNQDDKTFDYHDYQPSYKKPVYQSSALGNQMPVKQAPSFYQNPHLNQQSDPKIKELFNQRNTPAPKWNSLVNKINSAYEDPDDSILNKFRKPVEVQVKSKPSPSPVTDNFYNQIIDEDLKFKSTSIQNSNFIKPRSQIVNLESKKTSDAQLAKKSALDANKMKEDIRKKLNMTNLSNSSSSSQQKKTAFSVSIGDYTVSDQKKQEQKLKKIQANVKNSTAHLEFEKEDAREQEAMRQKEIEKKQAEDKLRQQKQQERDEFFGNLFGETSIANNEESNKKPPNDKNTCDEAFIKSLNSTIQAAKVKNKDNDSEQRIVEKGRIQMSYHEKQREEELRKIRYHNRRNADELIKPILNLELVEMFSSEEKLTFEPIPLQFESFKHYKEIWMPLFLYETYSQMINQRSETEKDKELLEAQGVKFNNNAQQKKHFEGFIQKSNQDMNYVELKLYECAKPEPDKNGNFQMNIIDCLKEFDLLLISEEPLPTNEVKKITNVDYLVNMKKEKGKMLCLVTQRRKKDHAYITLKVDSQLHEKYICVNVRHLDLLKVHVYYFDSLITTIREFRTIKSCEFFPTSNIILDPTLINKISSEDNGVDFNKKKIMNEFVNQHRGHFNQSQQEALDHVAKMKKEDFLLIQGPPGTGKTHTIQGIITMLVSAQVQRILICAPSNAAIDEIVQRIASLKLFGTLSERQLKEKLLRIGSMDYDPLPLVKKYTLDQKIKDEMDGNDNNSAQIKAQKGLNEIDEKLSDIKMKTQDILTIRKIVKSDTCDKEKKRIQALLEDLFNKNIDHIRQFYKLSKEERLERLEKLEKNYEKQREIYAQQKSTQETQRQKPKNKRSEVEKNIIEKAQIVCTTLSMSATEKLDNLGDIEYLIVDEACQCVELTDLIPFDHDPKKVILVGDQQQLPATTFSDNGDKTNYSRSLFERFLQCGVNRFMLSIQYRMHPLIREFPSKQFYEGKLQDAIDQQERLKDNAQSGFAIREMEKTIQNLVFFDLKYAQEQSKETSKSNLDEAAFIEELFSDLIKILLQSKELPTHLQNASYSDRLEFIGKELRSKIGIITPYKSQVRTLKDILYPKLRQLKFPLDVIEINTVDAYQGREKDIIIISCVRGSQERTLGFLNDYRRMNVAITRAKHFLWVIGNSRTLKRNENWDQFIEFTKSIAKEQGSLKPCYIQLNSKDQWSDHKLMSILTGTKLDRRSPDHLRKSPSSRIQKIEDQNCQKRQRIDDDKWKNQKSHQQEIDPERKRDKKYKDKNSHPPPQLKSPPERLQENKSKAQNLQNLSSTAETKASSLQENVKPQLKSTTISDIFDSVLSNMAPAVQKPTSTNKSGDIFSRIQKLQ